ncbi:MAG: LPXTG cell wall anchor domain-containing protein [Clostridia bacterium]|nr:LPXTG cell wall anchor domain-containing protein [Clostridia bacterium]
MKKFAAFILAFALVLSLGITSFAADTGTITISNPTSGHTYSVYKLFDATYNAGTDAVSYSIESGDAFYDRLFDASKNPVPGNVYFTINSTGNVIKVDGVSDENLIAYVTGLITASDVPAATPITSDGTTPSIEFTNLPYGYYIVKSTLGSVVTITSLAPDITIIDKNSRPSDHGNLQKKIVEEGGVLVDSNTASVGDLVRYRVSFNAPNYDGEHKIQYYTIKDVKGSALWVEFGGSHPENNISIKIGDETLTRGCYLPVGSAADLDPTKWEWHWLGDWGTVPQTRDNAQWYLVHIDYETFNIVIPWMSGIHVEGEQSTTYEYKFPDDATFLYENNSAVEINYCASVEPNAEVGGGADKNLYNRAQLNWTCKHKTDSTDWVTVYTNVYGIGIKKTDSKTFGALAGAEFAIYSDSSCTQPYYVIPTNIQGVYIKDDLNSIGQTITGENKLTARELYETQLEAYLGVGNLYNGTQKNIVTSPVNGKIVILGMDEGTYYVKETKAPDGYNPLSTTVALTAGAGMHDFHVYSNATGEVIDSNSAPAGYTDNNYYITTQEVTNSQGVELPSTGGTGTTLLIVIGTVLAMAFAVLLITHKKMTVYQD